MGLNQLKNGGLAIDVYISIRENPMGFLVVSEESGFQKEIIIRPDLLLPCKNQYQ